VWRRLGAPDEQIGSVNEPRETLEQGYAWNEKWVHRGDVTRVVLWNRYDLVGIFRVEPDGTWSRESLPDA
jgi:hypothetical protein